MDSTQSTNAATAAAAGLGLVGFVIVLAIVAFSVFVYWRIASKAGYNGALSLLMLVPLVNFIVLLIFAFGEWPIETRLKSMTMGGAPPMGGMGGMGGPPIGGPPATI